MATRFITGATNPPTRAIANEYDMGVLLTPHTAALRKTTTWHGPAGTLGGYGATIGAKGAKVNKIKGHTTRAYDNDAYAGGSGGKTYVPERDWWDWYLRCLVEHTAFRAETDFFVIPDKLDWFPKLNKAGKPMKKNGKPVTFPVGDAVTTLAWAKHWIPRMKAAADAVGWFDIPLAFVAQDGVEDMIDEIPWDDIAWIFIGGSDGFKEGYGAERVAKEAIVRGKKIHMGRVNSFRRMMIADRIGCDTADGTYIAMGPKINLPKVMSWIDRLEGREGGATYRAAKKIGDREEAKANAKRAAKKARSAAARKGAATKKAKVVALKTCTATSTTTRKAA